MEPISKTFVAALEDFARREKIPVIQFRKGQRKDDVAAEQCKKFTKEEGVVFIGKAQEKTPVFRTERRRNEETGVTYPWLVRSTAMLNQFYIYCVDRDFGPFFLKFSTYFPHNAKLCLNGHEYAKRQMEQRGIGFEALDNGVLRCEDPKRLQAICDGLSAEKDRSTATEMAAAVAAPLQRRRPPGRLSLPDLHLASGVLADPGAR
jgi:hypothetical protein